MSLFRYWWLVIMFACAFFTSAYVADAQITENGLPESFQVDLKSATVIPSLKMDSVLIGKRIREDKEFHIDNRYGVVQPCHINIKEAGVKTDIPGKGSIWRYRIESQDAYSLGLYFKTYHLPPKAKIFIYDPSHLHLRGAYTERNNNPGRQLPVADFPGRNMILEYFEPPAPEFAGEVVLGGISQAYTDLLDSQTDRIGINCPEGAMWKKEKNSVCLMTFHDWRYSYFCTGALINNMHQDQTPFFLTANHCIQNEAVANTMVTYFNYENSGCDTYDASSKHTVAGASFKAGSSYSDFTLLLLSEIPPDAYNPYFAGWDVRGNVPEKGVCIHHPNGLPKCLARDSLPIPSYNEKVQWASNGYRVISATNPNTHWGVEFDLGFPESGSSGSPLFDQNKRIVGQLHGGANFILLFGKLSLSWNYKASHSEQLRCWLDPDSTNTQMLDGIWKIPPKANFTSQLQQVCPNTPILFFDKSTQRPIGWKWKIMPSTYSFANGTDSSSQNPQIVFFEEGNYSVTLQTTNLYGTDEITAQNYIQAKKELNVKFLRLPNENKICGCDLKKFPVTAEGAVSFDFQVDRPDLIDIISSADSGFISMNGTGNLTDSFDFWVKVKGSNGICSATDSMLLHVVNQSNNQIANAARLNLGRNAGFSNFCATTEKNEPHPWAIGCSAPESWCPNLMGDYNVLDNSIWFSFISPSEGGITIHTNGFDDQIAVYEVETGERALSGNKVQYTLLAANDDRSATDHSASIENLKLIPGKEYLLQVDGNNAAYGDLVIDLVSNSLEVTPNPSKGIFHFVISNPNAGVADVIVSDLNGRKLYAKQYNVNLSNNKFEADLSGFTRGIYILNVKINNSHLSKKLVKW